MKEMKVVSCTLCPFVTDGSKYVFPECSLSERNLDDGFRRGVSSQIDGPIPNWCPLRKDPVTVRIAENK